MIAIMLIYDDMLTYVMSAFQCLELYEHCTRTSCTDKHACNAYVDI